MRCPFFVVLLATATLTAASCQAQDGPAVDPPPIRLTVDTEGWGPAVGSPEGLPKIESMGIGKHRQWVVNGKPFLPIMGWLQGPENLPNLKAIGINTIAGYWRPPGGEPGAGGGAHGYVRYARAAGLYFIPVFETDHMGEMHALKRSPAVLSWIHPDEPDLPRQASNIDITKGDALIINNSRPLWKMFDGDLNTSAILDPMDGATFTVELKQPITVEKLAVINAPSDSMAVAREISFTAADKELARGELPDSSEEKVFDLREPVTLKELTVTVHSVYEDKETKWGAISEIRGLGADGENRLASPPRKVPRESPEQCMARYRRFKKFDPTRPLLMTVSCFFIDDPRFDNWWPTDRADELYPALFEAADIPGFDVYPIYGWNSPEKLTWVTQGVNELRDYAGRDKPTYVWVETQPGGKFEDDAHPVTALEIRNEVYQALISGATAIGYFTHQFQPEFKEFGVPEDNRRAIRELNAQLTRLAPELLAEAADPQPTIEIAGDLPAQLRATVSGDTMLVIAQSIDMKRRGGTATIAVEGLEAGTEIEVVDENRTLTADGGRFTDEFGPLAVHIYRLPRE